MALPPFRDDLWLPSGHHPTTWEEIVAVFGGEPHSQRARVLTNLLEWRDQVQAKGMTGLLIVDGSFISAKSNPGDFDTIFVMDEGVELIPERDADARNLIHYVYCKEQGWGDIFVYSEAVVRDFPHFCRLDGFDRDKTTKEPKGVVEVRI